jgi:hypothetical protein
MSIKDVQNLFDDRVAWLNKQSNKKKNNAREKRE